MFANQDTHTHTTTPLSDHSRERARACASRQVIPSPSQDGVVPQTRRGSEQVVFRTPPGCRRSRQCFPTVRRAPPHLSLHTCPKLWCKLIARDVQASCPSQFHCCGSGMRACRDEETSRRPGYASPTSRSAAADASWPQVAPSNCELAQEQRAAARSRPDNRGTTQRRATRPDPAA